MLAAGNEGIVIELKRVPAIQVGRQAAYAAGHGAESPHIDHRSVSAGKGSEGGISRSRIYCGDARIVVHAFVVIAETDRVHEAGSEAVSLFDHNNLPRSERSKPDVSKCVRRGIRRLLAQQCSTPAPVLYKSMVYARMHKLLN